MKLLLTLQRICELSQYKLKYALDWLSPSDILFKWQTWFNLYSQRWNPTHSTTQELAFWVASSHVCYNEPKVFDACNPSLSKGRHTANSWVKWQRIPFSKIQTSLLIIHSEVYNKLWKGINGKQFLSEMYSSFANAEQALFCLPCDCVESASNF